MNNEAKQKAKELVEKYYNTLPQWVNVQDAKQCALIAVDEILILITAIDRTEHWQEFYEQVKTEIQNL